MNQKNFVLTAKVIFIIIAVLHLVRVIARWSVVLNGWTVPIWASWLAFFIAGYLAYSAMNLSK